MILKNITDNAKNLATSAKIEDMSRIFKNHITAKQDVKNVLSGVMVSALETLVCDKLKIGSLVQIVVIGR